MKRILFLSISLQIGYALFAQLPPNQPEQDCEGALLVCEDIVGLPFSYVGSGLIPNEINPVNSCLAVSEVNSVWLKVEVLDSGFLDFLIKPLNTTDDFDFAVYNLTNNSCADIANQAQLELRCNFAGNQGPTGLHNPLPPFPNAFESPLFVRGGETYVIAITNFTGSSNGMLVDFSASSALLFDTTRVRIDSVANLSNNSGLVVELENPLPCITLTNSAFELKDSLGNIIPIQAIEPQNCQGGYTDSVHIIPQGMLSLGDLLALRISTTSGIYSGCNMDTIMLAPVEPNRLQTVIQRNRIGELATICEGDSVLLRTNVSGQIGFETRWFPGDILADELRVKAENGRVYTAQTIYLPDSLLSTSMDSFMLPPVFSLTNELMDSTTCEDSILVSLPIFDTYQWSNGSTSPSSWFRRVDEGINTLLAINQAGCISRDTIELTFLPNTTASISINIDSSARQVVLNANATDADSIVWELGDGNLRRGDIIAHDYEETGEYTIYLTAFGVCGQVRDSLTINLLPTSIVDNKPVNLRIWMSQDGLVWDNQSSEVMELILFDLRGRKIQTVSLARDQKGQLQLGHIPSGIYAAIVLDQGGNFLFQQKVFKE
ncbi:MAG: PKD domain-containing protein [Bacteroidota bacterium]